VEARDSLPGLVNEFRRLKGAAESLADNAVEIGPHRSGGAWLVPAVDAQAAIDRIAELEDRIEQLEQEIEDLALARVLEARTNDSGDFLTFEQLVGKIAPVALADQRE
jgi:hypothetical protein